MTILILVCITTWSAFFARPDGFDKHIVSSIEEAAYTKYITIKNSNSHGQYNKEYTLYEINLETKEIKELEIPSVEFKTEKTKDYKIEECYEGMKITLPKGIKEQNILVSKDWDDLNKDSEFILIKTK